MRQIVCAVMLCLVSTVSMAVGPVQIVLERETFGGNPPPHMVGWGRKIVVYQNGSVTVQFRGNSMQPWNETVIGTLSEQVLNGIMREVADLQPGTLVYPEDPQCYDLPTTVYSAFNAANERVEFASNSQCLLGKLEGFYHTEVFTSMLDAFSTLGFYGEE